MAHWSNFHYVVDVFFPLVLIDVGFIVSELRQLLGNKMGNRKEMENLK